MLDLKPATDALAAIATAVTDDQLTLPTPCEKATVADLLDASICVKVRSRWFVLSCEAVALGRGTMVVGGASDAWDSAAGRAKRRGWPDRSSGG